MVIDSGSQRVGSKCARIWRNRHSRIEDELLLIGSSAHDSERPIELGYAETAVVASSARYSRRTTQSRFHRSRWRGKHAGRECPAELGRDLGQ